ncbi:hypothetical protein [Cellulomonas sp.]|uniref:hypothetical protein n=1 Tax=Cellulomonas sp. TaxID=40001 RepID=UPI00281166C9|nr:hypothetical protein [Cellulomonas sp.]
MRRTAWLVLSPWLVVLAAAVLAVALGALVAALTTSGTGGLEDLGGTLLALLVGAVVWCGGAVVLLVVVARRTFPRPHAGRAVLGTTVGGVVAGTAVATAGVTHVEGSVLVALVVPACVPAAGTVAFLLTERRLTGRALPPDRVGRGSAPVVVALAALAGCLVGAAVALVVDEAVLRPSERDLERAARELVPDGWPVDLVAPVGGTVLLHASPPPATDDLAEVRAVAAAAGWRPVGAGGDATEAELSRGDVEASVRLSASRALPFSVAVRRVPASPGTAAVGAGVGALVAGAGVLALRGRVSAGSRRP